MTKLCNTMSVGRRTLVRKLEARMEELIQSREKAIGHGSFQVAAGISIKIDTLQEVVTTIDETE